MKEENVYSGLEKFISESINPFPRNKWLYFRTGAMYVRRSKRFYGKCLDIASIQIEEKYRGLRIFSNILMFAETKAKEYNYDAIFIENILQNPTLVDSLSKKGYKTNKDSSIGMEVVCMHKEL